MNSLINAASGVTEAAKAAVWGKPEEESGTEPPTEDLSLTKSTSKPYDPGNSTDTAPTSPIAEVAEPGASLDAKAVELAIPAPGNEESKPADPSEGATATPAPGEKADGATTDAEGATAPAVATTTTTTTAPATTEAEKKDEETKEPAAAAAAAAAPAEAPKTPAKPATAAASKARDESPASTPGSGKKGGFRSKLKERLHIGSSKGSPTSGAQ